MNRDEILEELKDSVLESQVDMILSQHAPSLSSEQLKKISNKIYDLVHNSLKYSVSKKNELEKQVLCKLLKENYEREQKEFTERCRLSYNEESKMKETENTAPVFEGANQMTNVPKPMAFFGPNNKELFRKYFDTALWGLTTAPVTSTYNPQDLVDRAKAIAEAAVAADNSYCD